MPYSRLRAAVARWLTISKQETPHFYLRRSVNLDELQRLRAEVNDVTATRPTLNDWLIKAVACAHLRVPEVNVNWGEQ